MVSYQKFRTLPSGMIVLLKVAPVKSAPLVMELRRDALVRSTNRNTACVRLALVMEAAKKSVSVKLPRVRFAPPRLINSQKALVQMILVMFAPMRLASNRSEELIL